MARLRRRRRLRIRGGGAVAAVAALALASTGAGVAVSHDIQPRQQAAVTGVLAKGSGGPAVASLQRKLGLRADGVFGSRTRAAVRRFQRRKGLVIDGIVGPQTSAALGLSLPSASSPPQTASTPSMAGTPSALQRIAQCESGGNPRAIGGGGRYRGKYQFSPETWRAVGGSGDPAAAPEAEQDRRAAALYARSGTSSWPSCG